MRNLSQASFPSEGPVLSTSWASPRWRVAMLGFGSRQSARARELSSCNVCLVLLRRLECPQFSAQRIQFYLMSMTLGPTCSQPLGCLLLLQRPSTPLVRQITEMCRQQELSKCLRKGRRNTREKEGGRGEEKESEQSLWKGIPPSAASSSRPPPTSERT